MTKILNANCVGGVITTGAGIVPECPNQGEGGNSSGFLIISDDKFFYQPKTTPDVKSLIEQIENLCGKLGSLCDAIGAITVLCSGPGAPSGTPLNASAFTLAKTDINTIKSSLTTLKSSLK